MLYFDRYIGKESIKAATRHKRTGKKRPIRKLIEGPDVPLPQVWSNFISLDENKADLARYLSQHIISKGRKFHPQLELVTGGGFEDVTTVKSTRRTLEDAGLNANHEEADTRIVLHALEAVKQGYKRIVVVCSDTDVLILLTHFLAAKKVEVWMVSGTSRNRKCYPVHAVANNLSPATIHSILGFHALTGCDTVSSFGGYGKKKCWEVFCKEPHLLAGVGRNGTLTDVESYVCKLYGITDETSVNKARLRLFTRATVSLEMMPPSEDALKLHLARANHQAKVWLQADKDNIAGTPADSTGWKQEADGSLSVVWMTQPPVPESCLELTTCNCKSKCSTSRCKCYKTGLTCIPSCMCCAKDCCNPQGQ